MLTVQEARTRVLRGLGGVGVERVMLDKAAGRFLAEYIESPMDWPRFTNAAMDGVGVRFDDLAQMSAQRGGLSVLGRAMAGGSERVLVGPGEACWVMTGAKIPDGVDTVVMREFVRSFSDPSGKERVVIEALPRRRGEHIRVQGEDVKAGARLYSPGVRIDAGMVGVLASMNRSQVAVFRKPRVAIVTTGDELVEVDARVGEGQIVNSTSYTLASLVEALGGLPWVLPRVRDEESAVESALREAVRGADLVVSVGGVSVGDRDVVKAVIGRLMTDAESRFWKVAMRPGKPMAFGDINGVPLLGLPGNPVSSFVTFALFGAPAILKMSGCVHDLAEPSLLRAKTSARISAAPDRMEFARGRLRAKGGELWLEVIEGGSGNVFGLVGCDALGVVPQGGRVEAGEPLDVIPLGALGALG